MAYNPVASGGIWAKFELIEAFLHVADTCKNEEDPVKNEGATAFPIITLYELFFCHGSKSFDLLSGPKSPIPMMLQIKGCDRHAGCGDIHF